MNLRKRHIVFDRQLAKELRNGKIKNWWLSFCDPDSPKGSQFLGVIITQACGAAHAIQKTHDLGINPGGEVFLVETDETNLEYFDRFLTQEELGAIGFDLVSPFDEYVAI